MGSSQAGQVGVVGLAHTEHVWKWQKQSACWLQHEWRVQCKSWPFNKALAWYPYCSSRFWKPSPKSYVRDVHGKTCMQMTLLSSLNSWRNCKRSWSSDDHHGRKGLTWAKPRSWYLSRGSLRFRSLRSTPVACDIMVPHRYNFLLCTGQSRPKDTRLMTDVTVSREKLTWCHPSVTLETAYPLVATVNSLLSWAKFNELLPIFTTRSFPITYSVKVYNSCVRNAMLHASARVPISKYIEGYENNLRYAPSCFSREINHLQCHILEMTWHSPKYW